MEFHTGYQASGKQMIRRDARSEIHENFRNATPQFSRFSLPPPLPVSLRMRRFVAGPKDPFTATHAKNS